MNRAGFTRGGTESCHYGVYWIVVGCASYHCLMRNGRRDGKPALGAGLWNMIRIGIEVSCMCMIMQVTSGGYGVELSLVVML